MASRQYLLEKFQQLETERQRRFFCVGIWTKDAWRDEGQEDMLPENYKLHLLKNLEAALTDAGRPELFVQFERALVRLGENARKGEPNLGEILFRDVLGDLYPDEAMQG
jgi:hypothetical protein